MILVSRSPHNSKLTTSTSCCFTRMTSLTTKLDRTSFLRGKGVLKRLFRRRRSASTVETDASSTCSSKLSFVEQTAGENAGSVRFSPHIDVRVADQHVDPQNLWWQPHEIEATRNECTAIVAASQMAVHGIPDATNSFLEEGWTVGNWNAQPLFVAMMETPETRGLEFYIVPGCSEMVNRHVDLVLFLQSDGGDSQILSAAARESSAPRVALALLRGLYDAEDAHVCTERIE